MRFVRINSLTLKVDNALIGDDVDFINRPDYDMWIQSDAAKLKDTYTVATGTFTSLPQYPEDGKLYEWNEATTNWVEVV